MVVISTILEILTISNLTTPAILLIFTFALGAGITMIKTPIIPTLSVLVPRSDLPAALTLSAIGGNIGRIIGPTIGGFIVAAVAPWAVFFLYSAFFIGVIIVLIRMPRESDNLSQNNLQEY